MVKESAGFVRGCLLEFWAKTDNIYLPIQKKSIPTNKRSICPTLPTASPLESPSISCLLVDEELESCMETSGSTKVDGQCWVCKRLFSED